MQTKETVFFHIFRFHPDQDKKPYFREYEIPFLRKDLTVLEGLFYIQHRLDDSLAFRSSCRAAICGSCAMHINGKYRLACNTPVLKLKTKKITIYPLSHMPINVTPAAALKVMVAASDTFRAAAVEQLDIWSKRIGAEIVKHQTGSDPAAVAYDALEASIARGIDVVIVDTAGRLHTHENLMNELSKIKRVISKRIPGAPHEVLMVLDATTGQNALSQARMFNQAVDVTGIFLAKLDGTAKGGFVFGMRNEINIPVKYIGLGEKADDIEKFDPDAFVNALFE